MVREWKSWEENVGFPIGPKLCSILKSSTHVKCHFDGQRGCFFWGTFTKMCSARFPLVTVKASAKLSCHKIQWLQFAKRNIVGLPSWHSSRHFQIPITLAFFWLYNFNSALTATSAWQAQTYVNVDFPNRIGWRVITKVDWNLRNWIHWYECHYAVFRWKIWIGLEILTLGNRPKIRGLCLWSCYSLLVTSPEEPVSPRIWNTLLVRDG